MGDCNTQDYSGAVNRMQRPGWNLPLQKGGGKKIGIGTCCLSRKIVVNNAITLSALETSNLVPLEVWEDKYQEN